MVLAYLFPIPANSFRAVGQEAGDSRICTGIHYQMDSLADRELGKFVAQTVHYASADRRLAATMIHF